jgi:hypothetical protein
MSDFLYIKSASIGMIVTAGLLVVSQSALLVFMLYKVKIPQLIIITVLLCALAITQILMFSFLLNDV